MSYNKNTINKSTVDATIKLLKELKIPYKVKILGQVMGLGLNDDIWGEDIKEEIHCDHKYYDIRRLEYRDVVILEKMIRNKDCDIDDYIMSYEFKKGLEPKDWKVEEEIK